MADGQDKENANNLTGHEVEENQAELGAGGSVKINVVPATPRMEKPSHDYAGLKQVSDEEKEGFCMVGSPPSPSLREIPLQQSASQPTAVVQAGPSCIREKPPVSNDQSRKMNYQPGKNRDPNRLHEAVQVRVLYNLAHRTYV